MKITVLSLVLIVSSLSYSQAKIFQPGLISNNEEFGMSISPDGKNLLFVKAYGGRDTLHIYESSRVNGKWQKPQLAFFSSQGVNQIDPFYSPDGTVILINAIKRNRTDYDVFAIEKKSSGWSRLISLSNAINTEAHEFYATMAKNRDIYFTRRMESNDIYISKWDGEQYQTAIALPGNVNSDRSESNPYISQDSDFLIFASRRANGLGETDLYISFNKEGEWSFPINLGEKINTAISEFCPNIDLKNRRFLFSRTKVKSNGFRIENIYSIPLKKLGLKKLKKMAKWSA